MDDLLKCGCLQRKQLKSVLAACLAVCNKEPPKAQAGGLHGGGQTSTEQGCRASSVPPPGWCQVDPRSLETRLSLGLCLFLTKVSVTQMASASEGRFGTSI